jgi:hypothetical protein
LLGGGLVWLLSAPAGDAEVDAVPLQAREPLPGSLTSWVPPVALASAKAADWQVKVDGVDPPAGLPSAFPVPGAGKVEWFTFAPKVAQVAVVMYRDPETLDSTFDWLQYDLRQGGPPTQVRFSDSSAPEVRRLRPNEGLYPAVCALSPSGKRLAICSGASPFFVGIWSRDGKHVGSLKPPVGERGEIRATWVGFSDDDHLCWVLFGNDLTRREVATDKIVGKIEQITAPPALTPDGKWLITPAAGKLVFCQASDGKRAGEISLPDGWGAPAGKTTVAVHPSGREIAVLLTNKDEDMLLAVWDLATGQVKDAMFQSYRASQKKMTGRLLWAGKRRLLCDTILFDLDLHAALCPSVTVPGITTATGPASPDERVWCIRDITNTEWLGADDKLRPLAGTPPARRFLTAASVPEAISGRLDEARKGFLWHPGVSLRIVAAHSVPAKHRSALVESLAADLAKEGYRIDPNAPITVEIELDHDVAIHGRVLHADRVVLETRPLMDSVGIKKRVKVDEAFPRLLLRNALNRRLHLPSAVAKLGVDGLLAAEIKDVPASTKDDFDLPDDG